MVEREETYSEVRTVDVGANYGDARPSMPLSRDGEGEQRTLISEEKIKEMWTRCPIDGQRSLPGEVILASSLQISLPVILFSNLKRLNSQL